MVTHTRKVFNPAATNKDHRVLLQVMANTRNIRGNLYSICQTYPCNLAESRVRLFRRGCIDPCANTPLLRAALKRRRCRLVSFVFPAHAYELINRWHSRYYLPAQNIQLASRKEANRDINKIIVKLSIHFFTNLHFILPARQTAVKKQTHILSEKPYTKTTGGLRSRPVQRRST
jgi:hypothetical protein